MGDDTNYFLPDVNVKRISYAASAGDIINLSEKAINFIKQFDAVSVREEKLHKYLSDYNVGNFVCCDPTILAGVDCFEPLTARPMKRKGYVFVFMIWDSQNLLNNAKKFAKDRGLSVVSSKGNMDFFLHCRPEDFLSWIKNADYIFTNSFHGTVFSLLYHKKFISSICKKGEGKNLRIQEFLSYIGCCDNILIDETYQVENMVEPDYALIDKNIQKIRMDSLNYIKRALKVEKA